METFYFGNRSHQQGIRAGGLQTRDGRSRTGKRLRRGRERAMRWLCVEVVSSVSFQDAVRASEQPQIVCSRSSEGSIYATDRRFSAFWRRPWWVADVRPDTLMMIAVFGSVPSTTRPSDVIGPPPYCLAAIDISISSSSSSSLRLFTFSLESTSRIQQFVANTKHLAPCPLSPRSSSKSPGTQSLRVRLSSFPRLPPPARHHNRC